jgi:hypothetical protein
MYTFIRDRTTYTANWANFRAISVTLVRVSTFLIRSWSVTTTIALFITRWVRSFLWESQLANTFYSHNVITNHKYLVYHEKSNSIYAIINTPDVMNNSTCSRIIAVYKYDYQYNLYEELNGPAVNALMRAIAEVKQRWLVIGWVTKNWLSWAPRASEDTLTRWAWLHLQSLAPTNPHRARVVDYGPFSLFVIHKQGLCPTKSNKYGSVTWNNDPTKQLLQKAGLPIKSSTSLIRNFSWNQTSISYVNSSIKLNFKQSANVNLKPRKRRAFWIYVILFESSDTFRKEFVPS